MNLMEVFAWNPTQMITVAFSYFSEFYGWHFTGLSYADLASFCLDCCLSSSSKLYDTNLFQTQSMRGGRDGDACLVTGTNLADHAGV